MKNEIIILGPISNHPSGSPLIVGVRRDESDQAQSYFGTMEGPEGEESFTAGNQSYVCQVKNWDDFDALRADVQTGLKMFPGFEKLEWAE